MEDSGFMWFLEDMEVFYGHIVGNEANNQYAKKSGEWEMDGNGGYPMGYTI